MGTKTWSVCWHSSVQLTDVVLVQTCQGSVLVLHEDPLSCGLTNSWIVFPFFCYMSNHNRLFTSNVAPRWFHPFQSLSRAVCVIKSRGGSAMFELVLSPVRGTTLKPAPVWWPSTMSRLVRTPTVTCIQLC